MIKELFPHQIKARDFLLKHERGFLFHEVGIGKTNSAIAAINCLTRGKLLIVAPKCVIIGMWERYDDLPINHDVTMVSYEYLSRHHLDYPKAHKFDYIICDEVHKLKSRKSKAHRCIKSLAKAGNGCKFAWGLTGTPYATSFMDVHGIFDGLNVTEFKESYDTFMHLIYDCKVVYVNGPYFIYKPVKLKPGMMDNLIPRIAKHASVLRTEDCVKLPGFTVKEIFVEGMRTREYIDGVKGIITYANDQKETVNKLACVQKLHQISNGFVYDETHKAHVFKENAKIPICANLVEMELEERDKIIIVYVYKQDEIQLRKMLDNLKIDGEAVTYTNSFDEFPSKQVLLLQEQKAIGINLQSFTSCMIFYTFSYAYLEYNQTIGRIYRVGQKEPCKIYSLINKGTSENKIWNAVQSAQDMDSLFKELVYNLEDMI